jgi:hypothetical protein
VRRELHAPAYSLGNFLRTLATPKPIKNRLEIDGVIRTIQIARHVDGPVKVA